MENVSISKAWFEDIKNKVPHENAYYILEGAYKGEVEVDVDIEKFNEISIQKGWMLTE